jgi:3-hydroxybutyryl-CoA dehydrogenase
MRVAIVGNEKQKKEWLLTELDICWIDTPKKIEGINIYLDFLFEESHVEKWNAIDAELIVISSLLTTSASLPNNFIRINGWPGFLGRNIVEACGLNETKKKLAEEVFHFFGRRTEWVKDQIGFITARVVASIINEAYFSLGEGVSDKESINLAMKLGTNYPHGPFEWATIIGLKNVYALLNSLSKENERYLPAPLLEEEATK